MDRFDWIELESAAPVTAAQPEAHAQRAMPHDGPSFYRAAREMRASGHFRTASDFYQKAVGFDTHLHDAWVEWVDTLVRAKQLDQADAVSARALETHRQVRPIYAARALALGKMGKIAEAEPLAQVGVEGTEATWYGLCVRGELLLLQDSEFRVEALKQFDKALRKDLRAWESAFLAGWALLDAQLPTLAAAFFAEAAHRNTRVPICWLCLGDCYQELRLYEQAAFYYRRVAELEPTHELAQDRIDRAESLTHGLMRLFRREDLHKRWSQAFGKDIGKGKDRR
jgi:tetratricopeptide (TPR) repeat protein